MDISRFQKIRGLLGSSHDGERSAAALKASQMLAAAARRAGAHVALGVQWVMAREATMARVLIDLDVVVKIETALAYGVEDPNSDDDDLVWLPKSQCEWDGDTMTCPEWLAKEKGLI